MAKITCTYCPRQKDIKIVDHKPVCRRCRLAKAGRLTPVEAGTRMVSLLHGRKVTDLNNGELERYQSLQRIAQPNPTVVAKGAHA